MMMRNDFKDFRAKVLKIKGKRHHKIKESLGIKDAYKWLREDKFNYTGYIPYKDYAYIIREINQLFADNLLNGECINLPCRMGTIELRKKLPRVIIEDGKIYNTYSTNWLETLKLWYQDAEAMENKTIIKLINHKIFRIIYNRSSATYSNNRFIQFRPTRRIKESLKGKINNNEIESYGMGKTAFSRKG